jgi:integral membrane sensor domain MASE1
VLNTFSDTEFIEKETTKKWSVPSGILAMVLGCILVYSTMFATGNILYGNYNIALGLLVLIIISSVLLIILWKKNKLSTLS